VSSFFGVPPITIAGWMAGAVGAILLVLFVFAVLNRILLRMALRNLPRRRAQSVLILFGVMLATLIITASLAVGDTSAWSLQQIQVRQMAGIDEAFARTGPNTVQGAGTADSDFFTPDQLAAAIGAAKSDPNVAATAGVIVAAGSMVDQTTGQTSSQNVSVIGVGSDFSTVWGPVHSRSGGVLNVGALAGTDVFLGKSLGDRLGANPGDTIQLYIDGHLVSVTVRGILDTEVNPSIAYHGPIVNSVLIPLSEMRTVLNRPDGFNLIFVHNHGTGGLDDLGPQGTTGAEVTRRMRAAFTDPQSASDLKDYLNTPAIKTQIQKIHDNASFLSPDKDLSGRLLAELNRPGVTDEFKSLVGDTFVQRVMQQAVLSQSGPPDQAQRAADALQFRVAALQVDSSAAAELKTLLGTPAISAALQTRTASEQVIADLLTETQQPVLTPKFKALAGDPRLQQELGQVIAAADPAAGAKFAAIANRLDLTTFLAYKADAVTFAQQGGVVATGGLLAVSFFSICVGVLLIFLIFVMLAAERRAEMGMSRAVGLKRRHLTEMFLFEGMAYTLGATAIGVVLGVAVGFLMTGVLSTIFSGFYPGLTLEYHVEWTSLVIAASLGILLTFAVVAMSAYRVSRLNIVAAIRDLDESEHRDAGIWPMFTGVFATAWFGLKQLFRGHPLVFLNRMTLGALGAIKDFWWGLFKRGPMTVALGAALAYAGSNIGVEIVYLAGASLIIIGAGLLVRWILSLARVRYAIAARAGFTLAALGLLIYWGQPFGRVERLIYIHDHGTLEHIVQLDQMNSGPEVFALSALMVLLGAIWLVMFNSDLLIRGVMFFTGRFASLAPITRTSTAYPMATKFRTGMAVAMFGIVTFMVVFMSVFQDVLVQNFAGADQLSGGWQIVAGSPDNNFQLTSTVKYPSDLAASITANSATAADIKAVGWEDNSAGVHLTQVLPNGTVKSDQTGNNVRIEYVGVHVVDDGFLSNTTFAIAPRAAGYTSDRAVWDAVRDNTGYAVVDASLLDAQNGRPATITGIKRSDASFKPFQVEAATFDNQKNGQTSPTPWRLTVVGFMPHSVWGGTYLSSQTAMQSGIFAPAGTQSSTDMKSNLRQLRPTGYYFAVRPGVGVNKARLDLGRLLAPDQLEPVVVADQLAQQVGGVLSLLKLMTGFLALGLIVGIAGLGVISTRAVVERWQQIGMLRALGYRRSLIQRSFLMESSFIAIIGLVIGAIVGIWQSYTFFVTNQTFGAVDFHVPVVVILLILLGAYAATLLTTYLPSRAAAGVAPAEALRYE
jgi:putative ABC transport system permease protein